MIVIGIDLGHAPALALATGTPDAPVLVELRRLRKWDSAEVIAIITGWLEQYPAVVVYCEQTFTWRGKKRGYLFDVGRTQESQAGFLRGALWGKAELLRVPPVSEAEAWAAWQLFGEPSEGNGYVGEHARDACGCALKALIREDALARGKRDGM